MCPNRSLTWQKGSTGPQNLRVVLELGRCSWLVEFWNSRFFMASSTTVTCIRKALLVPFLCHTGKLRVVSFSNEVLIWRFLNLATLSWTLSFLEMWGIGGGSGSLVHLHLRGFSLLGTDFTRLIVCRPCNKVGVETMSFLKAERSASLMKLWNFVLVRSLLVGFVLFLALSDS
jgi:hypothetical protein